MQNPIPQPYRHAMMPVPTHDEHAREDFIAHLKIHMTDQVYPYDETVYERRVKPRTIKEHGRAPADCDEMHKVMMAEPFTQFWSAIARNLQDMLWANQAEIVAHQVPRLTAAYHAARKHPIGSLTIDPDFKMPRYINEIDIHRMPGGYQTSFHDEDIFAGAVYERGAFYYGKGRADPKGGTGARAFQTVLQLRYPGFAPKRMLDSGCSTGWNTTAYPDLFPGIEVHAIDVGAAMLRYAHARAESLGKKVHFSQQNGEKTNFPDGHFDLVVSGGVFHETSRRAADNMMADIFRVLKPGGVALCYDIPYGGDYPLHSQFMLNWDCYYNAEPFWRQWTAINRTDFMAKAGFKRANVWEAWGDRDERGRYTLFDKPFDALHTSARGGLGRVQFFGAMK